jgi:hypothetical protein
MSDTTSPSDDWRARAIESMEGPQYDETTPKEDVAEKYERMLAFVMLALKLVFFSAFAFVLVQRYGIGHLIWLALVFWYLIKPTLTRYNLNNFK